MKQRPVRDTQRAKVYRWERAHVFPPENEWIVTPTSSRPARPMLTLAECDALVEHAWSQPDYPRFPGGRLPRRYRPRIEDGRGRRRACFNPYGPVSIKLPRWSRFREVVLHEAAHAITYTHGQIFTHAWHGPEFMGVYLHLLADGDQAEVERLWRSAIHAGLRVTLWRPTPPRSHPS